MSFPLYLPGMACFTDCVLFVCPPSGEMSQISGAARRICKSPHCFRNEVTVPGLPHPRVTPIHTAKLHDILDPSASASASRRAATELRGPL